MKNKITLSAQILLGLIYFVFGLNGFLQFLPMPPDLPENLMKFSGALMETGYFFPFLKGTEVIAGLMLLTCFWTPVALTVLAPITINIFLVHAFLTPGIGNLIMPLFIIVLHALATIRYWALYRPLFKRSRCRN